MVYISSSSIILCWQKQQQTSIVTKQHSDAKTLISGCYHAFIYYKSGRPSTLSYLASGKLLMKRVIVKANKGTPSNM